LKEGLLIKTEVLEVIKVLLENKEQSQLRRPTDTWPQCMREYSPEKLERERV
jgi:hypothetical protein